MEKNLINLKGGILKNFRIFLIIFAIVLGFNNISISQVKKTTIKKSFPRITVSPFGGVILPIGILSDNFKPGGNVGLDLGYRVNKEVGFYAKFGYYFMNSKITGAPVGNYMEFSGGPRYYFTKPNLKSSLFMEAGVGGYNFNQNSYVNPNDTIGSVISQINDLRSGINAGVGANLALTDVVGIMIKSKYHVIFTPNGSNSFITVGAGIDFGIK